MTGQIAVPHTRKRSTAGPGEKLRGGLHAAILLRIQVALTRVAQKLKTSCRRGGVLKYNGTPKTNRGPLRNHFLQTCLGPQESFQLAFRFRLLDAFVHPPGVVYEPG